MFDALRSLFGIGNTAKFLGTLIIRGEKLIKEWKRDGQLSKDEMKLVADLVFDILSEAHPKLTQEHADFWAEWLVSGLDKARWYFNPKK